MGRLSSDHIISLGAYAWTIKLLGAVKRTKQTEKTLGLTDSLCNVQKVPLLVRDPKIWVLKWFSTPELEKWTLHKKIQGILYFGVRGPWEPLN